MAFSPEQVIAWQQFISSLTEHETLPQSHGYEIAVCTAPYSGSEANDGEPCIRLSWLDKTNNHIGCAFLTSEQARAVARSLIVEAAIASP